MGSAVQHSGRDAPISRRGLNFQHIHICFKFLEIKTACEREKSTLFYGSLDRLPSCISLQMCVCVCPRACEY